MTSDKAITASALGAFTLPAWLPSLHAVSQYAAELAPIVGLSVLIYQFIVNERRRWNRDE